MPSSRGSSRRRDRTFVSYSSCTAGRFFTAEPQGKPHTRLEWALNSVTGDLIRRDHVITKAETAGMLPQAKNI